MPEHITVFGEHGGPVQGNPTRPQEQPAPPAGPPPLLSRAPPAQLAASPAAPTRRGLKRAEPAEQPQARPIFLGLLSCMLGCNIRRLPRWLFGHVHLPLLSLAFAPLGPHQRKSPLSSNKASHNGHDRLGQ